MEKIRIVNAIAETVIAQGAKEVHKDSKGYYVNGWTQGVAALDLFNSDNNATYVCWYENNEARGVKAYFNQFWKEQV